MRSRAGTCLSGCPGGAIARLCDDGHDLDFKEATLEDGKIRGHCVKCGDVMNVGRLVGGLPSLQVETLLHYLQLAAEGGLLPASFIEDFSECRDELRAERQRLEMVEQLFELVTKTYQAYLQNADG